MFSKLLALLLISVPCLALAQSDLSDTEKQELLKTKIRIVQVLTFNPIVIQAVREQNAQSLDLAMIQQRDEEWKSSDALTPFKRSLQISKAGKLLKRHVELSQSISEAFLTDNQGATVATYPTTSDYWQGDEDKWTESFKDGEGEVYVGPVEEDQSTQTVAVQISAPVIDDGKTIGVLVVGVTLDYLEAKKAASN